MTLAKCGQSEYLPERIHFLPFYLFTFLPFNFFTFLPFNGNVRSHNHPHDDGRNLHGRVRNLLHSRHNGHHSHQPDASSGD
jgi:hypothetical protein